jgi:hypothetical protein
MRASTLNAPGSCRGGCSRKILMKSVAIRALVEAHLLGGVASLCAEHPNASASNGLCPEVLRQILAGALPPASKASTTSKPLCWPITRSTIRHARSGTGWLAFNSSAARRGGNCNLGCIERLICQPAHLCRRRKRPYSKTKQVQASIR